MTATPDDGATFSGWGGDCSGSDASCELSITGPRSVSAGFDAPPPPPPMFTLKVIKAGTGTGYVGGAGGIDCGPTCSATLQQGSTMSLLAVADDGSQFAGWSGGGCSGADKCAVAFDADKQVTARFDQLDRSPPHVSTLRGTARRGTTATLTRISVSQPVTTRGG